MNYLKDKIGVMESGRVKSGFCRPVLDKCRMVTYSEGQYVDNNTVVKAYMERTMTQIQAAQSGIISEHAKNCIADVSACYNSQVTQVNSYSGGLTLSPSTVKPILMGACRNVALSCAYAVFPDASDCNRSQQAICIDKLSEMFYQSMLCPVNSRWIRVPTCTGVNETCVDANHFGVCWNGTSEDLTKECHNVENYALGGWVNNACQCNPNYAVYNGTCTLNPTCPANSSHVDDPIPDSAAVKTEGKPVSYCKCNPGYCSKNRVCVAKDENGQCPQP